jgi:hypothetical protein
METIPQVILDKFNNFDLSNETINKFKQLDLNNGDMYFNFVELSPDTDKFEKLIDVKYMDDIDATFVTCNYGSFLIKGNFSKEECMNIFNKQIGYNNNNMFTTTILVDDKYYLVSVNSMNINIEKDEIDSDNYPVSYKGTIEISYNTISPLEPEPEEGVELTDKINIDLVNYFKEHNIDLSIFEVAYMKWGRPYNGIIIIEIDSLGEELDTNLYDEEIKKLIKYSKTEENVKLTYTRYDTNGNAMVEYHKLENID